MFQKVDAAQRETIIFMHENAGNIGMRMDWFEQVYKNLNVNILSVAYRGYSGSEGHPHQDGIMLDTEAILEFAKSEPRINNQRVFLLGRSLGGAVATHTQARLADNGDEWIKGVILENTFTSISTMADLIFPFLTKLGPIKTCMLKLDWNSEKQISKITRPIYIVAGAVDQLCPLAMSKTLYESATNSKGKNIFIVPNGDHNTTFQAAGEEYFTRLRQFMK